MIHSPETRPSGPHFPACQQKEEANGQASGDFCAHCISPDLMNRQLALEEEMLTQGRARWLHTIQAAKERRNEAATSYGHMLLKRGVEPLAAAIRAFQEQAATAGGPPSRLGGAAGGH